MLIYSLGNSLTPANSARQVKLTGASVMSLSSFIVSIKLDVKLY